MKLLELLLLMFFYRQLGLVVNQQDLFNGKSGNIVCEKIKIEMNNEVDK